MTDNPKTTISTWLDRFQSAMFRLCGTRPPADLCWDWIEADGSRLQNWVGIQPATPLWAMNIGVIDAAMILADATVEEEGHQTREEAIIQRRREKTAMSDPQTTEAPSHRLPSGARADWSGAVWMQVPNCQACGNPIEPMKFHHSERTPSIHVRYVGTKGPFHLGCGPKENSNEQ